jgi:hypothetical protein
MSASSCPLGIWSGLAADDGPIDAGQIQCTEGPEQGLNRQELYGRAGFAANRFDRTRRVPCFFE